jgi:hypothetical protein
MEKIALADEYFELIERGIKTSTIRYRKRDYNLGKCQFYSDTSDKITIVEITEIEYKTFGELTEDDALHDGFKTLVELKSTLKRFYPDVKDGDIVTRVVFKF